MATETVKNIYSKSGGAFIAGKGSCMTLKYSKTSDNKYYNLVIAINNTDSEGKFVKVDNATDSGTFTLGSFELLDLTILLEAMLKGKNNNIYFQHISKEGKGTSFELVKDGRIVNAFISYIENNKVVKEYQFDFTRTEEKKLQFVIDEKETSDVIIENYALLYFLKLCQASLFVTSNLSLAAHSLDGGGSSSSLGSSAGLSVSSSSRRSSRLIGRSTDNNSASSEPKVDTSEESLDINSIADMLSDDD